MSIADNVKYIRDRIATAALRAGADPGKIQLCAATKMNPTEAVRQAIAAGVDCCGENRVQEFTQKFSQDAYRGAPVHMIGHLQTNKVRQIVGKVDLIQSVDSVRLMRSIHQAASQIGITQPVLLQVNLAREESKSGFFLEQLPQVLEEASNFPAVSICGLMAIPPAGRNPTENHNFFQEMFHLSVDITAKKYDNVRVDILSMGMSDDFEAAIACGSNMIRLGSAIFGPRIYL